MGAFTMGTGWFGVCLLAGLGERGVCTGVLLADVLPAPLDLVAFGGTAGVVAGVACGAAAM